MLNRRSRKRPRWRPPAWLRLGGPAAMVGAFLLYKFAGTGAVPMAVVLIVWFVVSWDMWAKRPPDPGEFR